MAQPVEYSTLGSASAEFAEQRKGTITEGTLTALALLSQDVFTIPPRQVLGTAAALTVRGGRIVHDGGNTSTRSASSR